MVWSSDDVVFVHICVGNMNNTLLLSKPHIYIYIKILPLSLYIDTCDSICTLDFFNIRLCNFRSVGNHAQMHTECTRDVYMNLLCSSYGSMNRRRHNIVRMSTKEKLNR